METLSTIGIVLFVFAALPEFDAIKGVMLTNSLCFIPALLSIASRYPMNASMVESQQVYVCEFIADICAVLFQLGSLIALPLISHDDDMRAVWFVPIAIFLVSFGWWANYADNSSEFAF